MRTVDETLEDAENLVPEFWRWLFDRELRQRLPNSFFWAMWVPAVSITVGSLLFGWSDFLKTWTVVPGLLYLWYFLVFRVLPNRFPLGAIVGVAHERSGRPQTIEVVAKKYIRFMAAVISSEIAVGVMFLFLPIHQYPRYAFLAILMGLLLATFYVWQGAGNWWAKAVEWTGWIAFGVSIFAILMPGVFHAFTVPVRVVPDWISGAYSAHWDLIAITGSFFLWRLSVTLKGDDLKKVMGLNVAWLLVFCWALYGYHEFRYGDKPDRLIPATRDAVVASRKCPDVSTLVYHPTAEQFESYADGVPIGCRVRFRFRHEGWAGPFEIGGSPWTLAPGGKHTVRIFKWDGSAVEGTVESLSTDILVTGERASGDDKFASVFPPRRMPMPPARMISVLAGRHTAYQIEKNAGS